MDGVLEVGWMWMCGFEMVALRRLHRVLVQWVLIEGFCDASADLEWLGALAPGYSGYVKLYCHAPSVPAGRMETWIAMLSQGCVV